MLHSNITLLRNAAACILESETDFQRPVRVLVKQWLDLVLEAVYKNKTWPS